MEKIVSIVIPCFNHGKYIRETIDSIPLKDNPKLEIIIVNDGSTDAYTQEVLEALTAEGFWVVNQQNQGLGKTRNNGIKLATGKYILPLDADNKLLPLYLSKGIDYLEENPEISVLYGDFVYFGDKSEHIKVADFNLQKLMTGNYIDACAIFRRSAWEQIGGYDENMPFMGVEDWEFWLHLSFMGHRFFHMPEPAYFYRVNSASMIHKDTSPNYQMLRNYVEEKHAYYLNFDAPANFYINKFKAGPMVFILKLFLLGYLPKFYQKLVAKKRLKRF